MHRSPPTHCLAQTCRAVARDFPALTNAHRQVTAVLRRRWRRDEEFGRALIHRGSAWHFARGTVSISSSGGSSPAPLSPFVHASLFFASCSYPYLSCRLCLPLSILSMVDCRREIENTFYLRRAGQNSYGCRFDNNGSVESAVYVPPTTPSRIESTINSSTRDTGQQPTLFRAPVSGKAVQPASVGRLHLRETLRQRSALMSNRSGR